jgi:hypothetical protein
MNEIQLSLDDKTVSALQGPPAKKDNTASALTIFQITSIAAAGFWVLYTYATFQGESNALALRLAALQEQQSRAAITLATLDARKRTMEVSRGEQTPVNLAYDLKAVRLRVLPDGRIRYLITYNYLITNASDRPVNVDDIIIRGYCASTDSWAKPHAEVNDFAQSTPIRWERVFKRGHMLRGWRPGAAFKDGDELILAEHGGGGTGTARSGETLRGGLDLLLTAKPSALIGFKVRMRLGETEQLIDNRYIRTTRAIKSVEEPEPQRPNK